jgi:hypothetical protein
MDHTTMLSVPHRHDHRRTIIYLEMTLWSMDIQRPLYFVNMNAIIIISIHHELGLDRPISASSKVFLVVFVNMVYNSALFFASCCSFLLHVVVNLIVCFLLSPKLVLLPTFPNFLHSFYGQKAVLRRNFILSDVNLFLILFLLYWYIKKGIYSNNTKLFNTLPHSIKNLSDDPKQFKLARNNWWYTHSFYFTGDM